MIDRPLQTFSVAFKERAFSELDYARQVATRDRRRRARDRHRRPRLLRRAAAADLARGRADRPPVERAALLRLRARPRARQGRAHRRRQRRAARRLRQVPRALANWRAGGVYGAPAAPARRGRRHVVPRLPRPSARYAAPVVPGDAARPEAMFFDNFAAIGLAAPARRCCRRASPAPRRRTPTARRAPTSTRRTAQHACSTACSTPTSRPTWSSC